MDDIDFGTCCVCGEEGTEENPVRNGIMLKLRGPSPGKGWGCLICDLPVDGAMAFVCDRCLDLGFEKSPIRWVVKGFIADKGRVSIDVCKEFFDHDMSKHKEVKWEM